MTIEVLLKDICERFEQKADKVNASAMSKYMRNRFEFFGLKNELRKEVQKTFFAENRIPEGNTLKDFVAALWARPQRELHYMALEILEKALKKADDSWMPLLEKLIAENSWWDSVDIIAAKLIGAYLKKYPKFAEIYPEKWINSDNMWFRRTALLYQLKYKRETNFESIKVYILKTAHEKEFFIQKAQGWVLREYAKTDPAAVTEFVQQNADKLSNLTKREALKNIIL